MQEQLPTTVGFELEFSLRHRNMLHDVQRQMSLDGYESVDFGAYRRSPPSTSAWDLKTDSSCGFEAASPIISTWTELQRHSRAGSTIQKAGGRLNERCGFHVHLGTSTMTRDVFERFVRIVSRYQAAFYLIIPELRRGNSYCRLIPEDYFSRLKTYFRRSPVVDDWRNHIADIWRSKNLWFNCQPLRRLSTVEFRMMPGSLTDSFILNYVLFLLHIVDAATKGRKVKWGNASAKNLNTLFRTLLGVSGFYVPIVDDGDTDRAVYARKWALKQFRRMNDNPQSELFDIEDYVLGQNEDMSRPVEETPRPVDPVMSGTPPERPESSSPHPSVTREDHAAEDPIAWSPTAWSPATLNPPPDQVDEEQESSPVISSSPTTSAGLPSVVSNSAAAAAEWTTSSSRIQVTYHIQDMSASTWETESSAPTQPESTP